MIKVAMIGFGGIAQIHRYAYWLLAQQGVPVKLVAACDRNPDCFKTKTKINLPLPDFDDGNAFAQYLDSDEMLAKEDVDMVDICLPTKLHAPLSIQMLEKGYAVLSEKPMATSFAECEKMLEATKGDHNRLMIDQCLRFYPEYSYVKDLIRKGTYGKVKSAEFLRYSPLPTWSKDNWQSNSAQSGGCLAELNIHDIDVMRYYFGEPESFTCQIQSKVYEEDYAESHFYYPDLEVKVHSGWMSPDKAFCHGYTVEFEKATIRFADGKVTCTEIGGAETLLPIEPKDGIINAIAYFVKVLSEGIENTENPPTDSAKTLLLLERLRESHNAGGARMKWEVPNI